MDGLSARGLLRSLASALSVLNRDRLSYKLLRPIRGGLRRDVKHSSDDTSLPRVTAAAGAPETPEVFGRCSVLREQRCVLVDGQPARLGARAFDLLLALLDRRDRVVSKEELLDAVWPGLIVEENNLQVHVSALRKLFGAPAIVTVPGRGYRFTAPGILAVPPPRPGRAPAPARHNLPHELPSMHGRADDLAGVMRLLGVHRLVSIVGTGGLGKTRLAQQAALALASECADGAWLVELAALRDASQLPAAVARAAGIPWPADGDAATLVDRLRAWQGLLVLDNAEHLVEGVAALAAALLHEATAPRLLVTSQAPLKLPDECLLRLAPLRVADPTAGDDPDDDAVALFVARARAVQPGFAPDAAERAVIATICRGLDGLPLAIELAAARVPLLGVDGLRARHDQRLQLLTAGPRGAPQRQQTLQAALAWSHGLLDDAEQRMFRRLGVFVGGAGLELALATTADPDEASWAALDRLGALVDKSLLIADARQPPRYRLLESGRAFALERLAAAGEIRATMHRLAAALTRGLEPAADLAAHCQEDDARTEAGLAELDNVRAALAWAAGDDGDAAALAALVAASAWLWKDAGAVAEGQRWIERVLADGTAPLPPRQRARLLMQYAADAHKSDAGHELAALDEATALLRDAGDAQGHFCALTAIAQKLVWRRDLAAARRVADEAAALWDPAWPPTLRQGLLGARTYILEMEGRPSEGEAMMRELVALMRGHGSLRQLDQAEVELAENLFIQGKAAYAVTIRRQIAARMADHRVAFAGMNLANMAAALTYLGRIDEALDAARQALPLLRLEGRMETMLDHFALLACRRGLPERAARVMGCADRITRSSGFEREASEQRAHDTTLAELAEALPASKLARLRALGEDDGVEVAIGLALG